MYIQDDELRVGMSMQSDAADRSSKVLVSLCQCRLQYTSLISQTGAISV